MDSSDNQYIVNLEHLEKIGFNTKIVVELYKEKHQKILNLNDLIKVSTDEEAKKIKFETADSAYIIVPAIVAAGSWNKVQ